MNSALPENLAVLIFILNILLVLVDASLGFFLAPHLLRLPDTDEAELRETAVRTVRRMLTALVALYMFFNCLGYFNGDMSLLLIVTALVVSDLGGQVYLRRRAKRREKQP